MSENTLPYEVAQFIAGATDDPAYCALLKENDGLRQELDRLRQENRELGRAMLNLNNDKVILYRALEYAVGCAIAKKLNWHEIEVLEKILTEVSQ